MPLPDRSYTRAAHTVDCARSLLIDATHQLPAKSDPTAISAWTAADNAVHELRNILQTLASKEEISALSGVALKADSRGQRREMTETPVPNEVLDDAQAGVKGRVVDGELL